MYNHLNKLKIQEFINLIPVFLLQTSFLYYIQFVIDMQIYCASGSSPSGKAEL